MDDGGLTTKEYPQLPSEPLLDDKELRTHAARPAESFAMPGMPSEYLENN
jgi:hypothetical protein